MWFAQSLNCILSVKAGFMELAVRVCVSDVDLGFKDAITAVGQISENEEALQEAGSSLITNIH